MKVTKRQLQRLIKEELRHVLNEQFKPGAAEAVRKWDPEIAGPAPSDHHCPYGTYPLGVGPDGVLVCGQQPPTPRTPPQQRPQQRPELAPTPRPPLETALPKTMAAKRSAYDAQKDLDFAIKAYNFWGLENQDSEEFANAAAAINLFQNEMLDMGVEPGSIEPFQGTPKKGIYQIGREPVFDPKTGKPYPRHPYK